MDISTATFGDSPNRCPYPKCPKPSLCRPHLALLPESLLEEYDMRRITKYFRIRKQLRRLSTADPSTRGSQREAATPDRTPEHDSAAHEVKGIPATGSPSRVAASSIKTICMDCKVVIREGEQDYPVSHGLCSECLPARMGEAG